MPIDSRNAGPWLSSPGFAFAPGSEQCNLRGQRPECMKSSHIVTADLSRPRLGQQHVIEFSRSRTYPVHFSNKTDAGAFPQPFRCFGELCFVLVADEKDPRD